MMFRYIIIMAAVFFVVACQTEKKTENIVKVPNQIKYPHINKVIVDDHTMQKENKTPKIKIVKPLTNHKMKINMIAVQGTIHYFDLEGGFYGIITKKGQKLLPLNLAKKYQQAGAVIEVEGELVQDMMTIQQWGTPFKIINLKIIKTGITDNNLQ